MLSESNIALLAICIAFLLNIFIPWIRNIRIAKQSGLPYVIVPYYTYNRITSLLFFTLLLKPCTKYFGQPHPLSWRALVTGSWQWKFRHAPYALLGVDALLTVAPGGIMLLTSDADAIADMTSRQNDFPKATRLYETMNIYGENVVTTEGAAWRYHRRLMGPVFGEINNRLVWQQALRDGHIMLAGWLDHRKAVTTMARDTKFFSLSVMGEAGLGHSIQWPGESSPEDFKSNENQLDPGHKMTFTTALATILHNIYYLIILPKWALENLPFKAVRESYQAYIEWGQYMQELLASKRKTLADSQNHTNSGISDVLGQLVKEHERPNGDIKGETRSRLTDAEVLGNLFIMVFAGHETSATSIHLCLLLLAMHPHIQQEVQHELDAIFQNRAPAQWNYDQDLPKLLNSKLHAVLNEQLRLLPPAVSILKCTTSPQTLRTGGKTVTVPADTIVRIGVPAVHRNPKFWQTEGRDKDDVEAFRPSRWYSGDDVGMRTWHQPVKGAFVPFSEGARSCIGKRFAEIEILTALAFILSSHSIELAIEKDASEKDLSGAWARAKDKATWTLRHDMSIILTLQINKGRCVPVDVVKRGKERFMG